MTIDDYRNEIKLKLTGNTLELEIADKDIDEIIYSSIREIQRYIDLSKIITIPYQQCIDMTQYNVSAVTNVYRASSFVAGNDGEGFPSSGYDPAQVSMWQLLGGTGNMYNFQNYALNYASWNTMLQIRNTTSTDLNSYFDKTTNKLYINVATNIPTMITIEYIPKYIDVTDITSDFWVDVLMRMSIANTKIILGRIRSRYTQSNSLWQQDGATLLEEGKAELDTLREQMRTSNFLSLPMD